MRLYFLCSSAPFLASSRSEISTMEKRCPTKDIYNTDSRNLIKIRLTSKPLGVGWSNAFCVRLMTYCCECGFAGALYRSACSNRRKQSNYLIAPASRTGPISNPNPNPSPLYSRSLSSQSVRLDEMQMSGPPHCSPWARGASRETYCGETAHPCRNACSAAGAAGFFYRPSRGGLAK